MTDLKTIIDAIVEAWTNDSLYYDGNPYQVEADERQVIEWDPRQFASGWVTW